MPGDRVREYNRLQREVRSVRFSSARRVVTLLSSLALVLAFSIHAAQDTDPALFEPLSEVYRYIQSYFYKPDRIDDQEALYGAIDGLVRYLDDPYSEFWDPEEHKRFDQFIEGEFTGVGIEISIVDGVLTVIAPLADTPAEAAGVLAGDRILAIDGTSTEGIQLSEAVLQIQGDLGTTVVLTVQHDDGTLEDIPIVRATINLKPVESDLLAEGTIAYVRITFFAENATLELDRALASFDLGNLTGIILDLRNNGGGVFFPTTIDICSRFIDNGVLVKTEDRMSGAQQYWSRGNRVPNLPLAVLINRGTASASEITAGAIRDNNMGILIGEQSFGKGVIQSIIGYRDGSALKVTTGEYFTPLGSVVHRVGLAPDIVITEGEDPIEVAIEWINAHSGVEMPIDLDQETAQ
jgi:carboxyl-terminal processing protease